MNDLLKDFAEKARVQDRDWFIYQYGGPSGHQSVEKAIDLDLFARLIIQECSNTLRTEMYRLDARPGQEVGARALENAQALIKNRFGAV